MLFLAKFGRICWTVRPPDQHSWRSQSINYHLYSAKSQPKAFQSLLIYDVTKGTDDPNFSKDSSDFSLCVFISTSYISLLFSPRMALSLVPVKKHQQQNKQVVIFLVERNELVLPLCQSWNKLYEILRDTGSKPALTLKWWRWLPVEDFNCTLRVALISFLICRYCDIDMSRRQWWCMLWCSIVVIYRDKLVIVKCNFLSELGAAEWLI